MTEPSEQSRAVPQVPLGHLRRGHRPGPRHRAAAARAGERPHQPRLPVQRPARLRQDLQRPHPGPLAELRPGPDARPVRRVRLVQRARAQRPRLDRRHRDRRGQPRRRRRRPRPARARVLRAGPRPLQGLHHRRGAHGHHAGLQRPAQARRGAAGLPGLRLRHHRAGQGAHHDPVAHPPLPVPADPARRHARAPRSDLRGREASPSSRPCCRWWCAPAAARRATRCRSSTSCSPAPGRTASPTRSAVALLGVTDGALLDDMVDALAAGDAAGGVRHGRPRRRGRARPAPLLRRPARPLPRPHPARRRARRRRARADRRAAGPARRTWPTRRSASAAPR